MIVDLQKQQQRDLPFFRFSLQINETTAEGEPLQIQLDPHHLTRSVMSLMLIKKKQQCLAVEIQVVPTNSQSILQLLCEEQIFREHHCLLCQQHPVEPHSPAQTGAIRLMYHSLQDIRTRQRPTKASRGIKDSRGQGSTIVTGPENWSQRGAASHRSSECETRRLPELQIDKTSLTYFIYFAYFYPVFCCTHFLETNIDTFHVLQIKTWPCSGRFSLSTCSKIK